MLTKVVLLLALFGFCLNAVNHVRYCDREQPQSEPTNCYTYAITTNVEKAQGQLQKDFMALDVTAQNFNNQFRISESNLKLQMAIGLKRIKPGLDNLTDHILNLSNEVEELMRHKETVDERNITAIEQRLNETERLLEQEARKLKDLKTKTKEAFKDTEKILEMFKKEISDVNTTASELVNRADSRVNAAKQELDGKLAQTQRTAEGLATRLNEQREKSEEFMNKTEVRFEKLDQQLETQSNAVTNQRAEIYSLSSRIDEITTQQSSTQVSDLRQLQSEVDSLTAAANATVAFSASITESDDVFTGPGAEGHKILKFNHVFTNVGNSYCNSTGIFTAPVKGVYHFSFMTFGYNSHTSGAMLVVNGEYRVGTFEFKGTDTSDTTSSSVILELNKRDDVLVALWDGGKVHEAVFSGFLISPLS